MTRRAGFTKRLLNHYQQTQDPVNEFPGRHLAYEPSLAMLAGKQAVRAAIAKEVQRHMPKDPKFVSFSEKCGLITLGVPIGIFTALYFMRRRA